VRVSPEDVKDLPDGCLRAVHLLHSLKAS
jgi:hypothetical protein